jgi:hypothetical protein
MPLYVRLAAVALMTAGILPLAACNPSSGGAAHPRDGTVVVPAPAKTVCADGTQPPCQ